MSVAVPADIELFASRDDKSLKGVFVLEGTAHLFDRGKWTGQLYREWQPRESKPIRLRLIPYFAWNNRDQSEMTVWMPLKSPQKDASRQKGTR